MSDERDQFTLDVTDLLGEIVTKMTDPHNQLLARLHQTGHVSDSDLVRLEQEVLARAEQVAEDLSGLTLREFSIHGNANRREKICNVF